MADRRLPRRSQIGRVTEPNAFIWATGIEDTFVADTNPRTGRHMDEYELTHHYEHWEEDFRLMASLGVHAARYGIPWYRINPQPGKWDFEFADRTLNRMLDLGIEPIVDLVHYGTPPWLTGGFTDPDYPARVSEYAAAVAERFKGSVYWYTPLNEPRITSWYCGKIAWWPPFRRGWRGFMDVMLGIAKGVVLTDLALDSVDSEIVRMHVDATDIYEAQDASMESLARLYQDIVFLALDLVTARVTPEHPLWNWMLKEGIPPSTLDWFQAHATTPDLLGINLYPMFTLKEVRSSAPRPRMVKRYATGYLVDRLGHMYWDRYHVPLMISETASLGTPARRTRWLRDSVEACNRLRSQGVPMVGYTWWPMFALVGWAYRQSDLDFHKYLLQMGLWDLEPTPEGELRRVPTSVIEEFKSLIARGSEPVGSLTHFGGGYVSYLSDGRIRVRDLHQRQRQAPRPDRRHPTRRLPGARLQAAEERRDADRSGGRSVAARGPKRALRLNLLARDSRRVQSGGHRADF